jgi:membrane fusion protein, heavy metal efflux system
MKFVTNRCRVFLHGGLILLLASACSDPVQAPPEAPKSQRAAGEVVLKPDSPKKGYIKLAQLEYSQPPAMEPLAGKIVYDENITARVSSPIAGRVISTPMALGSKVQAGSALLSLSSPDTASAQADYLKAQAQLTLSEKAFQRQRELYEGKVVALKDLEQAEDDLSQTRSELQRAALHLKNLHLQGASDNGQYVLRAPIAGTVVERNVNPGQELSGDDDPPLFVITDLAKLVVFMDVFEVNLSKIHVGQNVAISVPAYPEQQFPAVVRYIGQVLNEDTRTVQVRCELPNPDRRLLPGMYASIIVESAPEQRAIVIPLTAVFTEGDSDFVFVQDGPDRYLQKPVKIGLRLKDEAVVLQGLEAGQQLVSEGALVLRAEEDAEDDAASNNSSESNN